MINVLTTKPEFMFKFTWDREWLKKLKGDRKVKFFQKFENHWAINTGTIYIYIYIYIHCRVQIKYFIDIV